MKAYFSVSELLDFGLSELPKTKVGLGDKIKRESWQVREVPCQGGNGCFRLHRAGGGLAYRGYGGADGIRYRNPVQPEREHLQRHAGRCARLQHLGI